MKRAGIILCGGQSSRMGSPKAWLPFGSEFMLQRVSRILQTVAEQLIVVAAPEQELPTLPSAIFVLRDEERGRGPLQGLAAGLQALEKQADAAYVSSCDVPLLKPEFAGRMFDLLGEYCVAVPRVGGYLHPLAAVYRAGILPSVRRLLAENRLRPAFLFDEVRTRVVETEELADVDPGFQSLRNLNTPEDYQSALAEFLARP